jgi:NAD(P)H dehydrogenase (quinone)
VLVNATFFGGDPGLRQARVLTAIGAATDAGASHLVLTSWPDLDRCTITAVQDYHVLEEAVRTAGPAWTIVRAGVGVADTLARDVVWAEQDGELAAPAGTGTATPADVRDLAEATAMIVADPPAGAVIELTGPDPVSWADLAAVAGVAYRPISDEAFRERVVGRGFPAPAVESLLDIYRNVRAGWSGTPTDALGQLLGRDPKPGIDAVAARASHVRRLLKLRSG